MKRENNVFIGPLIQRSRPFGRRCKVERIETNLPSFLPSKLLTLKGLELGISRFLFPELLSRIRVVIIHLGLMLPSTSSSHTRGRGGRASYILLFGLAPDGVYRASDVTIGTGALLPHRFTCTTPKRCSLLSVALSIASPLLGVIQHPALWSPDFPHPDLSERDHLPNSSI